jgi:RNA polymerase sigma-70 factor (ECF subfamily)
MRSKMSDVNGLIQRWQAGDERAAEALYDHHRASVFRLAYGLLGEPADAEEVAQDALTYALVNIHRYDARRASFATWLHRGGDVADLTPGPERRAIRAETHGQIWDAVLALSQPLREAVLLRYWAGHTYREMADVLGCPLPTAQSRVRLAYKQLRKILAPARFFDLIEEETL